MSRPWGALLALALFACSDGRGPRPDAAGATEAQVAAGVPAVPQPPPYGEDVKSLRLKRSIAVRMGPAEDAKPIGTVAQDMRVLWKRAAAGPGCPRWIEIEPRGWVCDKYLEPSTKPPFTLELPKLKPGELVPGTYGHVSGDGAKAYKNERDAAAGKASRTLAGHVTVRRMAEITVGGKAYWKTSSGELILASKISEDKPSSFEGIVPGEGAPALPLAWAQSRKDVDKKIPVYDGPDKGAKVLRKLEPRTVVALAGDPTADEKRLAISEGEWPRGEAPKEWIDRADLHVARPTEAPPTTFPEERWVDVDLDEQTLVAYDGPRPVFATLVSTGNKKWPTATGVYRIWIKFAETDMNGQMGDEQPYSVATVPWTEFFAKDLALHTSYWHDRFGENRSHGCVNLSPKDARRMYFWTEPNVPTGWTMAHGIIEAPGSIVRIRSKDAPQPDFQGYAKRVFEARGGAPVGPAPGEEPLPPDGSTTTASAPGPD